MPDLPPFAELAAAPDPALDELALALAAEFHEVDAAGALARLDALGAELVEATATIPATPQAQARACTELLGAVHGFAGDRERYDDPDNSMLDLVLARRRGLPILLSVVYIEVARRAGIPLAGLNLPGHFVVGHFGATPPLVLDPFAARVLGAGAGQGRADPARPAEIALRMLNNLVASFERRGHLAAAIRAASMRLALPAPAPLAEALRLELRTLRARLN
ncbi:MAG: transglutaminase-like domain-containing protein [Actinomycetota bacterium]|nr:transglutaminase-like domain-containing protein [Actinomycetota bacterium]